MPNANSNLLTTGELLTIYSLPVLDDVERKEYFSFNKKELTALRSFKGKNIDRAVYFAICLVFFKIRRTLLNFSYQEVTKERQHVMQRYFYGKSTPRSFPKDAFVITRIENKVLTVCGYQRYDEQEKIKVLKQLAKIAARYPRQRKLCQEFLVLLGKNRISIPAYSTIQDDVSEVWNNESKRVVRSYYRYTTAGQRATVLSLMEKTDNLHKIVSIKQDMKGFRNSDLDGELEKHNQLKPVFDIAKDTIPKLQLPKTTVSYYGGMINYYNGSRLKNVSQDTVQLYLLCYTFTRYQMLNDDLLMTLKKRATDITLVVRTTPKLRQQKNLLKLKVHAAKQAGC